MVCFYLYFNIRSRIGQFSIVMVNTLILKAIVCIFAKDFVSQALTSMSNL